ncbi:flagellin [Planococcus dechangensis]|uniref:Flagellin n=1 Tax=Planococcus dechangensis TaxID=1176255 RepID=A0ABV9M830_9BACL
MIINHNITALNTHRQLSSATNAQANSMEKLSSGLRINSAKDDAAGLSISEKMRGQIRGLEQASRNSQDAISMIQTAEGALNETHDILQRMRELTVQAGNDTNTADDREVIQVEIDDLVEEIGRIATTTQFNGQNLLDGTGGASGVFTFQIGANTDQQLDVTFATMDAAGLGVDALDVSDAAAATAALTTLDDAIKLVSDERSQLGAKQNRLDHTTNNLNTSAENLTAAESRIRDVDYAEAA